ncbi:MAG: hypothetical protein IPJ28_14750 [Betaproteobacteria bacterium]|nr:hypothetical protein [Betaproteobacteria bacterium]
MDDFACFLRACLVVLSTGLSAPTFPAEPGTGPDAGLPGGARTCDVRNPQADA